MPRSFRLLQLVIASIAALALSAVSATAATVANGGFETGDLNGWVVFNEPASGGNWFNYTGTEPPLSTDPIPAPFAGSRAAIADQGDQSSSVLYQDIALEAGQTHVLQFHYFFDNTALGGWEIPDPPSFSANTPNNQQLAIDVIRPTADPLTTNGADILASALRTVPADPATRGWTAASLDLSAFAGQTVRFRYLNVNNQGVLYSGLDEVSVVSTDISAPVVSALTLTKSKFVSSGKGRGTTIGFSSDDPGTAVIKIFKSSKGKRSGKKCVKRSKRLDKKRNCSRWVQVRGSLTSAVVSGQNSIVFTGKMGSKALATGKYKLELVVTNGAGLSSVPSSKTFTVVKKKKKK